MAGIIDYKQKYQELKAKFMSSVESAWNDGFQHGMDAAQTDQAQQQAQQADAMAQAQMGGAQPNEGDKNPTEISEGEQGEKPPVSANPNEDELGQHIEKLENMLGKSEISSFELQDLKKTLNDIRSLQVQINLKKSLDSIKNTKLAKSTIFNLSPKNKTNLPAVAQKSLSIQQEIVDNVFKKWENESKQTASGILNILGIEGLTKKE